jgi:uncharacterized protein (TIGR02271 family)
MISHDQARDLMGADLKTADGDKVGRIGQIFLDDQTGQPEWLTVSTGMFGTRESFVPLAQADVRGNEVVVPYSKDQIKNAPNVDIDAGHLDQDEESRLYSHYGVEYGESYSNSGYAEGTTGTRQTADFDTTRGAGHDTSGPNTDDAMTRSEERIRTGTEKVQTGRARLRKWVETENVQVTVPVTRERARLETEPITEANRDQAMSGGDLTSEEHEVTLTEERPIVTKETVPVERVRLTTETETTQETVTAEQRKERIAAEGDVVDVAGTQDRDIAGRNDRDIKR